MCPHCVCRNLYINRRIIMTKRKTMRILSVLLSMIMLFSLSSVFCITTAYAETEGEWRYTVKDGKATITAYIGVGTSLTVPARLGGVSVSSVTGLANLTQQPKITSITFSSGITEIGASLCKGYTALQSVTLPNTITTIGGSAFASCPKLTGIKLPSSLVSLGASAFQNCTSLISASVTGSVTELPNSVFADCAKLGNVSLPESLTTIGASAFANCTALGSINLPASVTTIADSAFLNCSALKGALVLPAEIKTVGEFAFAGCSGVTSITIPNKAKEIKTEAFRDCTSMTACYIGKNVNKIAENIFAGCTSLDKVVFGGSYVNIKDAFDIKNAPTVYYPSSYKAEWDNYKGGAAKKAYTATSSIKISGNKNFAAGTKLNLKISITPNTSVLGKVYYITSSNPAIATVDPDGVVTGKAGGTAKITVTTINGVSETVTVKVTPKKVTGVKAVSATTSSIKVNWKAVENVTGYIVYRSAKKDSGYKEIATTITNSYTDKGLTKGSTYYYKVRAYVKSGSTTLKSASSAYDGAKATSPAPSTVSAKKAKSKVATITWGKSIGAEGYEIAMASSKNGKFKVIKTITSGSTLTYKKTGLTAGKTYYFKVRSYTTVNGAKVYSDFTKVVKVTV